MQKICQLLQCSAEASGLTKTGAYYKASESDKNWLVLEFALCMTAVEKVKQFKEYDRKFQIIFIVNLQCQTSLKGHSQNTVRTH